MFQYNFNTPIAALTVGQLMEVIGQTDTKENAPSSPSTSSKKYAHGLRGIRELFDVSHATAQRYKDSFLQPAIMQNGRKIVVDVDKAMELFNEREGA